MYIIIDVYISRAKRMLFRRFDGFNRLILASALTVILNTKVYPVIIFNDT